jgi:hypothetical protein
MDPFSSPPLSGSAEGPSNEVVMDKVKQQLAQAYAEEFFSVKNLCPTLSLYIACLLSSLSLSLFLACCKSCWSHSSHILELFIRPILYGNLGYQWYKNKNKLVKNKVFALWSLSRRRILLSLIS